MSMFSRIDPDHPLAQAAREVDNLGITSLEEGINALGMNLSAENLAYLSEQRAIRAIAATKGYDELSEEIARHIIKSDEWKEVRLSLISAYMDGLSIGWKARELAGLSSEGQGGGDSLSTQEKQEQERLVMVQYSIPATEMWSEEEIKDLIQTKAPSLFTVKKVELAGSSQHS